MDPTSSLLMLRRSTRCSAYAAMLGICIGISASTASTNNTMSDQALSPWQQIEAQGKNQDVYFYAWGGDPQINAYLQWAAKQVEDKYDINLVHVKLSDTSEAVSRVLAEKSANNNDKGSVDLV